jgi:hypothetical protein
MAVMISDPGTPSAKCTAHVVMVSFFLMTVSLIFRLLILGIASIVTVIIIFQLWHERATKAATPYQYNTFDEEQIHQLETH